MRAIGEGRRQFANVQKFVRYLLSSNAGEVIALVVNIAIGGPLVFLATQILWMNLVTDGVTAVALGLEKSEPDQMQHPATRQRHRNSGFGGLSRSCLLGTLHRARPACGSFFSLLMIRVSSLARTTAFTAMVVFEKVSVFAFRSLQLAVLADWLVQQPVSAGRLCGNDGRAGAGGLLATIAESAAHGSDWVRTVGDDRGFLPCRS